MPIAFDAASHAENNDGTASLTFSHTVSGTNRLLIVETTTNQPQNSVTGITYNGVSMTSVVGGFNAASVVIQMFYLIAPDTGTHNVVVTMANNTTGKAAQAASYTGVLQTGFPDATSTLTPLAVSNTTQTITTMADNCWIAWGVYSGGAITAVTNCVVRGQESTFFGCGLLDTNSAQTPAGLKTMVLSGGGASGGIQASFAPVTSQILKVSGVAQSSIGKVSSVANASIEKVSGVLNQ